MSEAETEAEALRYLEKALELVDTAGLDIVACYLQFSIDQLRGLAEVRSLAAGHGTIIGRSIEFPSH